MQNDFGSGTRRLPPDRLDDTQNSELNGTQPEPPAPRRAPPPKPRPSTKGRQRLIGGCLAVGGALLAFVCVGMIVAAILLPSIYRAQRPEVQSVWCSRAERLRADFVCNWRPTPPFDTLPTLSGTAVDPADALAILTPDFVPTDSTNVIIQATATETPAVAPLVVATESGAFPTMIPLPTQLVATTTPTSTSTPSPTMSPTPFQPSPMPTATLPPLPTAYKLQTGSLIYQAQTWNNCGPATLSMGLSYFGYRNNQSVAARFLKPNAEDKNVSPVEMAAYVNEQAAQNLNIRAAYRVGGDLELLKRLIANEFPVIVEKGYDVNDLGWMGHYLLVMGYDDAQQVIYAYDSYLGHGNSQGLKETYADLQYFWRHFNYTFLVLYPPEREQQVMALLGHRADEQSAAQGALELARQQAADNPADNWAWFNLGRSYTMLGDHTRAVQAFDQAFVSGMPWRTLWYLHEPYQSYYAVGRYDDVLAHTQATQSTTVYVEETFYYRGAVLAAQGDVQGAVSQFTQALTYNSNYQAALQARDAVQNGTFSPEMVLHMGTGG